MAGTACAPPSTWVPPPLPDGPFPWGIASGDPMADRTVLWTRLRPPAGGAPGDVTWEVAADEAFSDIAGSGVTTAEGASDHTVKVEASGLDPGRPWFYRFTHQGVTSAVGRTITAPAPGDSPSSLKLAFASCQMFTEGYFSAYRHIVAEGVDAVLHLGDYVYEYGSNSEEYGYRRLRTDLVDHPKNVDEFRHKYRLAPTDPDLVEAHRVLPFITIWDDHEIYDDYDRDVDPVLRAAGYQAWFEYMPVVPPAHDATRVDRSLRWGDLADLYVLDLAQYREVEAPAPFNSLDPHGRGAHAAGRTLIGDEQRSRVKSWLSDSDATWRVVGNPQMLQHLRLVDFDEPWMRQLDPNIPRNAGLYLNGTQWDGYQAERDELLRHWETEAPQDNIVLTGDIHSWWVGNVHRDIDAESPTPIAAEFVGGSITSPSFESYLNTTLPLLNGLVRDVAGRLEYVNLFDHGYGVIEVTPTHTSVMFRRVDIEDPAAGVETLAEFRVDRGSPKIHSIT